MINNYLNDENKLKALEHFNKVVELGVGFKLRKKIFKFASFEEIFNLINSSIPELGSDLEECLDYISEKVLPYSTNYSSPFSMAFPDAGNSIAALSGSILLNFLNQNLINWSPCSPVGTVIEMVVLNWLRQLVGYEVANAVKTPLDLGGLISTGGVSSNTIAQLIARELACPNAMVEGIGRMHESLVSIVPNGIEHYSSRLSMGWLGLGEQQVIKAPTVDFKYDLPKLADLIEKLTKEGKKIMSLVAYAGDSRSMTIDNFVELRKICDKYNVWFHIDGCHGTQLLFSNKLKGLLKGIELADSVTFDPHKVLNIPYTLSVLLLKNVDHAKLIQRPEDIITGEEHSFGQITPFFGSKAFYSFKLFMLIKNLGVSGIGEMVEKRIEMAKMLAEKVKASKNFVLINQSVNINSVIFMYCPDYFVHNPQAFDIEKLNELNMKIQKECLMSGDVWLHNFTIPDLGDVFGCGRDVKLRPLRFMSGNPLITEVHLDEMLNKVEKLGIEFFSELTV